MSVHQPLKSLFFYSRRFEPLSSKNGKPKRWAAYLFEDEMTYRRNELQGYLNASAKRGEVHGHETGFAGRSLTVETGTLWTPVVTGISMNTAVNSCEMDRLLSLPHLIAGSDGNVENTYLIAVHSARVRFG